MRPSEVSFTFFMCCMVGISCYLRGCIDGRVAVENIAIERGACEWYADPKTGVKELKWKCGEVPHEQAD